MQLFLFKVHIINACKITFYHARSILMRIIILKVSLIILLISYILPIYDDLVNLMDISHKTIMKLIYSWYLYTLQNSITWTGVTPPKIAILSIKIQNIFIFSIYWAYTGRKALYFLSARNIKLWHQSISVDWILLLINICWLDYFLCKTRK